MVKHAETAEVCVASALTTEALRERCEVLGLSCEGKGRSDLVELLNDRAVRRRSNLAQLSTQFLRKLAQSKGIDPEGIGVRVLERVVQMEVFGQTVARRRKAAVPSRATKRKATKEQQQSDAQDCGVKVSGNKQHASLSRFDVARKLVVKDEVDVELACDALTSTSRVVDEHFRGPNERTRQRLAQAFCEGINPDVDTPQTEETLAALNDELEREMRKEGRKGLAALCKADGIPLEEGRKRQELEARGLLSTREIIVQAAKVWRDYPPIVEGFPLDHEEGKRVVQAIGRERVKVQADGVFVDAVRIMSQPALNATFSHLTGVALTPREVSHDADSLSAAWFRAHLHFFGVEYFMTGRQDVGENVRKAFEQAFVLGLCRQPTYKVELVCRRLKAQVVSDVERLTGLAPKKQRAASLDVSWFRPRWSKRRCESDNVDLGEVRHDLPELDLSVWIDASSVRPEVPDDAKLVRGIQAAVTRAA